MTDHNRGDSCQMTAGLDDDGALRRGFFVPHGLEIARYHGGPSPQLFLHPSSSCTHPSASCAHPSTSFPASPPSFPDKRESMAGQRVKRQPTFCCLASLGSRYFKEATPILPPGERGLQTQACHGKKHRRREEGFFATRQSGTGLTGRK